MEEMLAHHPGLWSRLILGFDNPPFIDEWYDLAITHQRLCVVAPREHVKFGMRRPKKYIPGESGFSKDSDKINEVIH